MSVSVIGSGILCVEEDLTVTRSIKNYHLQALIGVADL